MHIFSPVAVSMETQEAFKKLIPMSDDEINELVHSDINITSPSLSESLFPPKSPTKSIYADFSMNSFVVIDTPEVREDTTNVYMESVVDLLRSLNTRMETLSLERTKEMVALEKIRSHLSVDDMRGAQGVLSELKRTNPEMVYLYEGLIYGRLPDMLIGIRQELVNVKETIFLLRNSYSEIEGKYLKRTEENERLQNLIGVQGREHKGQIEGLVTENSRVKDQLLELHREYSKEELESQLVDDVVEEIRRVMGGQRRTIQELGEEVGRKDEALGQFERKANMFEVSHLTKQVESLKETQRKLQDENLNLTQIVNKLSEKNTKLKQELIFFNSEVKKGAEALARKNETIARQKSLIELFQEKIGGGREFPIEDLRRKKEEIEERLENESDYFVKQKLQKEREDCTKRLSDFLNLQMNKR